MSEPRKVVGDLSAEIAGKAFSALQGALSMRDATTMMRSAESFASWMPDRKTFSREDVITYLMSYGKLLLDTRVRFEVPNGAASPEV